VRETALQATERRFSEQQYIREITAMEAQRMPVFRWLTCALSLAVKAWLWVVVFVLGFWPVVGLLTLSWGRWIAEVLYGIVRIL
jgi:hypothetical protein